MGATGAGWDEVWAPAPRDGTGVDRARHRADDRLDDDRLDDAVVAGTTRWSGAGPTPHERVQAAPEFAELRRRQRRFVFPMTAVFLLWYLAYVLLACFARDLMAVRVADGINLGLVIGLLQFVSTFLISTVYVVYARHRLDPLAEELRARVESGVDGPGPPPYRLFDDPEDGRR